MANNYTQDELAGISGIPRVRISGLENNRYDPRIDEIRIICRALGISADWWLCEQANPHARLRKEIDNLSPQQASILCVMFDFLIQSSNKE